MIDHSGHAHPSTPKARAACRANGGTGSILGKASTPGSEVPKAVQPKTSGVKTQSAVQRNAPALTEAKVPTTGARVTASTAALNALAEDRIRAANRKKAEQRNQEQKQSGVAGVVKGRDLRKSLDFDEIGLRNPGSKLRGQGWDEQIPAILSAQGFDGKPRVVRKGELEGMVSRGEAKPAFRAVIGQGSKSAIDINEQMRSGPLRVGSGGYGNGIYFAPQQAGAQAYADQNPQDSDVLSGGIRSDAKVIGYPQLIAEMKAESAGYDKDQKKHKLRLQAMKDGPEGDKARLEMDEVISSMTREEIVLSDPGRFAAAKGYDVISVGYSSDPWKDVQEYVVLNRTALIVEER